MKYIFLIPILSLLFFKWSKKPDEKIKKFNWKAVLKSDVMYSQIASCLRHLPSSFENYLHRMTSFVNVPLSLSYSDILIVDMSPQVIHWK